MSVSFCLPHPVAVSAFMICKGLYTFTEMLWMCGLYVGFGSKVIGILNQLKNIYPQQALLSIYNALFLSHMTYSLLLWGNQVEQVSNPQKK